MVSPARRELTALRLSSQRITANEFNTPVDVVRWMLAMQAQDLPGAKWSIGLRLPGSTDATIDAAIADGSIVRSWPMRGTLHFVAAEDLHWMLAISGPRQATWAAKRRNDLAITDQELGRAAEIAQRELSGGRVIRRDALLAAFEAQAIPITGQRGYHLLWNLAHDGLTVFGPMDGKHPTFCLLDEWVAAPHALHRDEALALSAARYFASHGPATERDYAWWASITLGDARAAIAQASLESRDFDGVTYYFSPGLEPAKKGVYALPGFDEYMLGYQDRSAALDSAFSDRIVPGNNGVFLPTIVADGHIVGTWKRAETTKAITVEAIPFNALSGATSRGFERAIARYGKFMGKPARVREAPNQTDGATR